VRAECSTSIVPSILLLCGLVGGLGGCQKYQPVPLEVDEHRARWEARSPQSEELMDFAQSLAHAGGALEVDYDPANGLTLAEAEIVALYYNADLRESRERAQVSAAAVQYAGLWDDPDLSVDVGRILENVPDPWVPGVGIGVSVPISGRLDAQRRLSEAEHSRALAQIAQQEWDLIIELRRAWIDWSAASLRAQITDEMTAQIEKLVDSIDEMEGEDELPEIEARLFRLEAMMRSNDARGLRGRSEQLDLHLKQLVGLNPHAPVEFVPSLSATATEIASDQARDDMLQAHPELLESRAAYEEAERSLALEIRKQYPDIFIGPSIEHDENDQTRIGISGSLPLAIWNRNRSAIGQARAERQARRAAFEAALETRAHELAQAQIEWETARDVREDFESEILPLLEEQIGEAREAREEGDFDAFLQLETIVRFEEGKLRLIDAREQEALAAVRVNAALGPASR
jgi:outer membrane protein, heavy metal efflux system